MPMFPTSSDIYLEANGKKVMAVQSYTAKTVRADGPYSVKLTRLYPTDEAIQGEMNFHELENFSLVICKPDQKIIYSGCHWTHIWENGSINAMAIAEANIIAEKRTEEPPKEAESQ